MMKQIVLLLLVLSSIQTFAAEPKKDTLKELEARIEELEKQQAEIFLQQNRDSGVRPFSTSKILLGGFFESGFYHLDGKNMESQTTVPGHLLGINLAAEVSEKDRIVAQLQSVIGFSYVNKNSDPRMNPPTRMYTTAAGGTIMAHGYYEHMYSELFNVQLGIGYVPFGRAFRERDPISQKRRSGDTQMFTAHSGDGGASSVGIAIPLWMGLHVHGASALGSHRWGYNAYTLSPTTNTRSIGGGGRLWYQPMENITVGVSGQTGEQIKRYYRSIGGDIDIKVKNYGLTMEYAESTTSGEGPRGPQSFYVLPYVEIMSGKLLIYAVADYMDNPTYNTPTTGLPADPYIRTDYGVGINWLPKGNMRFRLGYTDHQYSGDDTVIEPEERDYYSVDLSGVVAF